MRYAAITAAVVNPAIDKILSDIGIPFQLGTDNDPPLTAYTSEIMQKHMQKASITSKLTHMHHGQMEL